MVKTADEIYLDTLVSQRETNGLEFKRARTSYDTEKAISYCAAIANEGGGHLILGVEDKAPHEVLGTSAITNPQELEMRIYEKLRIKVSIREVAYQSKRAVVFQIPSRLPGVPIEHDGRFLMRAGESLVSMSAHRIAEILAETQGSFESRPIREGLTAEHVEILLDLDTYFRLIPDTRPKTLTGQLGCLVRRGLLVSEAGSARYSITALGALFLAFSFDNFPELRTRRIRFIKYAGPDRVSAVFEHFEVRGYGACFEDLLALVASHTPVREVIEGGLRQTIPIYAPTAVREFLANALIHQDLADESVQITIEIFSDRLEIRNPGEPLIPVRRFVDETRSRNSDLAEIMRLARICEVRGSGVDRALQQIEDYLQPAPTFRQETSATTITMFDHLEFADMTTDERVWAAFLHCCIRYESSDRLTNTTLRERFGLGPDKVTVVSQTIAAAVEMGVVKLDPRVGSSKRHAKYVPFFA
jgi:ATP-dependent DNA helicase RecG